jgi:hypothetical protein
VDREEDLTVSWMAIDDQLHASKKFRKLRGDRWRCTGFWVTCGSWCRAEMTDGFVPDYVIDEWDPDHGMSDRLVDVGLWIRSEQNGEAGYQFHDWFDYNMPVAEIIRKREANARRQAEWRERQRGDGGRFTPPEGPGGGGQQTLDIVPDSEDSPNGRVLRDASVSNALRNTHSDADGGDQCASAAVELRPAPRGLAARVAFADDRLPNQQVSDELPRGNASRNALPNELVIPPPTPTPTHIKKKTCARTARDTAGPPFEQWYAAYPRKKGPEAAARAYLRARRLVSHEVLMVATHKFARECSGTDMRYVKHPATWLNQGCWADEPDRPVRAASGLMDL